MKILVPTLGSPLPPTTLRSWVVEPLSFALIHLVLMPAPIEVVFALSSYLPDERAAELIVMLILGMMTCWALGSVVSIGVKRRSLNPFYAFPILALFSGGLISPILGFFLRPRPTYSSFLAPTGAFFLTSVVISFEWLVFAFHFKVIGNRLVD